MPNFIRRLARRRRRQHYIVVSFAMMDIPLTARDAAQLLARDVIYRVPEQPDDGQTSYYVNGRDEEDDRRILEREGLL